ncbi:MAG TPA: hypothetical protein VJ864_16940 [Candidatus Binatia bacterium]|nr:hypothetical protein [Candidatus Binatia bacterium]
MPFFESFLILPTPKVWQHLYYDRPSVATKTGFVISNKVGDRRTGSLPTAPVKLIYLRGSDTFFAAETIVGA